jgi:hypothetical protein
MVINPDFWTSAQRPEERRPLPARARFVNAAGGQPQRAVCIIEPQRFRTTTMRAILLILIIIVLVVIAGVATGYIDINQIRGARAPQVAATGNGITAKGGQAPAFDVETGSVSIGTKNTTVKVPALIIHKPGQNEAETNAGNAM